MHVQERLQSLYKKLYDQLQEERISLLQKDLEELHSLAKDIKKEAKLENNVVNIIEKSANQREKMQKNENAISKRNAV